jgi:L-lactate dehydrogenase complex protein LldG
MGTDHASAFETALAGTTTLHRTSAAEFAVTLEGAITAPAVGTELPFDGVSLADTPVDTDPSPADIEAATTGVTPAGLGVADYGTVTLPSSSDPLEVVSLYCTRHVAVLAASDLVADMPSAYERLRDEFAAGTDTQILATGTSSTADMGQLIQGVHGPHETHVVLLEDR